jgi:hypothetical protein
LYLLDIIRHSNLNAHALNFLLLVCDVKSQKLIIASDFFKIITSDVKGVKECGINAGCD